MTQTHFCIFEIISPLKRTQPCIEQFKVPLTQGCFMPSLIEIGLLVLEKKN
jgi:hypothetical protein